MPTLSKRIWPLPSGEDFVTFRVEWKENKHLRRKVFSNVRDAAVFLAQLGIEIKARKALGGKPVTIDRVVRPRGNDRRVVPFRRVR